MGYGALGYIGISAQQSFGTATTSYEFLPFIRETLSAQVEQLQEENMRGRFDKSPLHAGAVTVQGEIEFEPHPVTMGHLLRGVFGQASSTAVTSAVNWDFALKQSDFSTNCALPPFSFIIGRNSSDASSNAVIISDCIVSALTIDVQAGAIVKATASILGRTVSRGANVTPTYLTGNPFFWKTASMSIAGAANVDFENVSFKVENAIEGVLTLDNTQTWRKFKRTDAPTFSFDGTADFTDYVEYSAFVNGTDQRAVLNITGTTSNDALLIDVPNMRYTAYPINISGPGRLSVGFTGVGLYNTTSLYSAGVSLVNTRAAYTP